MGRLREDALCCAQQSPPIGIEQALLNQKISRFTSQKPTAKKPCGLAAG
jgi:hypothetical protein